MTPQKIKTGLATALVCLAFGPSLEHIHQAVVEYGQDGWVAWAIALSVDGLAAYVGLILQERHRAGLRRWDAILILLVTVAATVSAQVVTAQWSVGGVIVAVWPAVAFLALLVLIELDPARRTKGQVRGQGNQVRVQTKGQGQVKPQVKAGVTAPMTPLTPALGPTGDPDRDPDRDPGRPVTPAPERVHLHAVTRTTDPKVDRSDTVAEWVKEGRPWMVMLRDGAEQFGCSESTIKRLVQQARDRTEQAG